MAQSDVRPFQGGDKEGSGMNASSPRVSLLDTTAMLSGVQLSESDRQMTPNGSTRPFVI